ncbi:hypothetical protein [Sulfitobacter sp. 1A12779]|uniref:hypothetical protein n=1 Tax=Sulfitobacter sp. 1A12779 TaxID=3368599 RepID=UPI003745B389
MRQNDTLDRIVEFNEASAEKRAVSLCNSSVVACKSQLRIGLSNKVRPRTTTQN